MQEYRKLLILMIKNLIRIGLEILAFVASLFFRPERDQCFRIDNKLLLLPATKLSERIRSGDLKSEDVVRVYIEQAKQVDKCLNAIVEPHFDSAIEQAQKIDEALAAKRRGEDYKSLVDIDLSQPLVGVPVSIKETIGLAGASFTGGVATRITKQASESNSAVGQLVKAGLIPIASTNTPCMNMWFDSYNLLHGRTRNPYDRSRIPGGSSGGEAALIAAAGSLVGVGSDLAGSIRIPCSFCGIFGHKPTPLVVATDNSYPACLGERELLRSIGPMTRHADDLLPMLKLMVKSECRAKLRLDEVVDLRKIRLFYCTDLGDPLTSSCERDIVNSIHAAVQHLVSKYEIPANQVNFDNFKYGLPMWSAVAEGGQAYAPEHPEGFVPFNPLIELVKCLFGTSMFPFNAIVCGLIEKFGAKEGSPKQLYLKRKSAELRDQFNSKLGQNGVLLMPTHPHVAPHHYTTLFKFLNVSYTAVANTLHAPITQCPLGMSREGLPIGVQLITTQYNDRLTLAVAQELERAFGGWLPPVKTVT